MLQVTMYALLLGFHQALWLILLVRYISPSFSILWYNEKTILEACFGNNWESGAASFILFFIWSVYVLMIFMPLFPFKLWQIKRNPTRVWLLRCHVVAIAITAHFLYPYFAIWKEFKWEPLLNFGYDRSFVLRIVPCLRYEKSFHILLCRGHFLWKH